MSYTGFTDTVYGGASRIITVDFVVMGGALQ